MANQPDQIVQPERSRVASKDCLIALLAVICILGIGGGVGYAIGNNMESLVIGVVGSILIGGGAARGVASLLTRQQQPELRTAAPGIL